MTESKTIEKIQKMCKESFPPDIFKKWEIVKVWLMEIRKINKI